ncbi:hypothetical protein [Micromonospora deserti]|uniref:hypothetical protein n=1 Tax=Micromonospora deserti TaxID=2070366 RepID=UPI0011B78B9C|nr:hypothetical protein [Micromonospora deserti]
MSKQDDRKRRATGVVNATTRLLGLDGLAVVRIGGGTNGSVVTWIPPTSRHDTVLTAAHGRDGPTVAGDPAS